VNDDQISRLNALDNLGHGLEFAAALEIVKANLALQLKSRLAGDCLGRRPFFLDGLGN
jgi:hypothetical protein